jgi:hypothetical protein
LWIARNLRKPGCSVTGRAGTRQTEELMPVLARKRFQRRQVAGPRPIEDGGEARFESDEVEPRR